MENTVEHLKFPIGRFKMPKLVTQSEIREAKAIIGDFPKKLDEAFKQLSPVQLELPYRPNGWTARQVIHHCADSHMNALIRFKLALTEDNPVIKPYDQAEWANLADNGLSPSLSIILLDSIHKRWVALMDSMAETDWKRTFVHPEHKQEQRLEQTAILYAWHCEHHLAHVKSVG